MFEKINVKSLFSICIVFGAQCFVLGIIITLLWFCVSGYFYFAPAWRMLKYLVDLVSYFFYRTQLPAFYLKIIRGYLPHIFPSRLYFIKAYHPRWFVHVHLNFAIFQRFSRNCISVIYCSIWFSYHKLKQYDLIQQNVSMRTWNI